VELRGWVDEDEAARLYSTATAFAIPSLAEGFSLPVLEAMSAGVPVLLSDIDVHRYVGGDAARFFTARDDASLAAAIDEVVSDSHLRARMTDAGYLQERKFTWDRTARETLAVFRRVLDEAQTSTRPRR
jgi:glycosyltransferase involved in cell wall biosynthesis